MKQRMITALIAAPLFLFLLYLGNLPFIIMVFLLGIIGCYEVIKMYSSKEKHLVLAIVTILYMIIGFFGFGYIRLEEGLNLILLLMITIWATDSGAYFVGKKFGKIKLAPSISPNKTVEGSLGGTIIAIIIGLLYQYLFPVFDNYLVTLIILIAVSLTGQIGDLIESKIKRIYEVKDSGNILPGHGGIFDRFDSMILVFILIIIIEKINII